MPEQVSAAEGFYRAYIQDWMEKNRIIHRLEKRVCRLKRANRNLREEIMQMKAEARALLEAAKEEKHGTEQTN